MQHKWKKSLLLVLLGGLMVAAAVALLLHNERQQRQAGKISDSLVSQMKSIISMPQADAAVPDDPDDGEMVEIEIDGEALIGLLSIPELEIELPVLSHWSYSGLEKAPCRYSGTVHGNDLVLLAHNYMSHFGKLADLPIGSKLMFQEVNGNQTQYSVVSIETLEPESVKNVTSGEYDLTLFTCTYGAKHRIVVRCMEIDHTVNG